MAEAAVIPNVQKLVCGWWMFYRNALGLDVNFGDMPIPDPREGCEILVAMPPITRGRLWGMCEASFPCSRLMVRSLDHEISSIREARERPYAVWLHGPSLKQPSYCLESPAGSSGMTVEERMVCELRYWHGDERFNTGVITPCDSSSFRDGGETVVVQRLRGFFVVSNTMRARLEAVRNVRVFV